MIIKKNEMAGEKPSLPLRKGIAKTYKWISEQIEVQDCKPTDLLAVINNEGRNF